MWIPSKATDPSSWFLALLHLTENPFHNTKNSRILSVCTSLVWLLKKAKKFNLVLQKPIFPPFVNSINCGLASGCGAGVGILLWFPFPVNWSRSMYISILSLILILLLLLNWSNDPAPRIGESCEPLLQSKPLNTNKIKKREATS